MRNQILLVIRGVIGGTFMGLANLIPGISGGTMLLASGVYPKFISAVAEVTTFTFRRDSLIILAAVGSAAVLAILMFAGSIRDLVIDAKWIMFSLFIGLTLGGAPTLYALMGSWRRHLSYIIFGILSMGMVAIAQLHGSDSSAVNDGWIMMMLAGVAGASAMILPGISGGYLLLLTGTYLPILNGIDKIKVALKSGQYADLVEPIVYVAIPVGIGVVVGIVAVSHLFKLLLRKCEKQTYALLFGVLCGAVFGLWPFDKNIDLEKVSIVKGQTVEIVDERLVYQDSQQLVKPKDYPKSLTLPSVMQGSVSIFIVAIGFLITIGIARIGRE